MKERSTQRKYIPGDHQTGASFEIVENATQSAIDILQRKYGDRFEIEKSDDDNIRIAFSYKQVSLEKTRLIQVVEKESEMILTRTDDGFTTSRTPLPMQMHLALALEAGYQTGETPVSAELVDAVLSKHLVDLEPTLARYGTAYGIWSSSLRLSPRRSKRGLASNSNRCGPLNYGTGC